MQVIKTLRHLIPYPCKHWYECLIDRDYRYKSQEIARLKSLPRY